MSSKKVAKENMSDISALKEYKLSEVLENNINIFKEIFCDDDTLVIRYFENQKNNSIKCSLFFIDGMIKDEIINEYIIKPIMLNISLDEESNAIDIIQNQVIVSNGVKKTSDMDAIAEAIISGNTVVLVEGFSEALIVSSIGWQTRAIEEPKTEMVLRGPREGFTEALTINLTLIRRRLKTNNLKFKYLVMGRRTHTKICICYINGIANQKILNELNRRLESIDIDAIIDSGYIQEMIKDAPLSLFKTVGSTERPDVVVGNLVEGRIALLVDGSPIALTIPYIFAEYFQSSEDYYVGYYYATIGRVLRMVSFLLTISIPSVYVALVTFHQEMLPTPLLLSISSAIEGTPFPTAIEAIGMLFVFEILREAGVRMPTFMGQALSIIGALVIGQAAVQAKFISAPMVIIVAFTGITGIMAPKLQGASIIIRYILIFLSSVLGIYGYLFGISGLLLHLFGLRSFGIPYMYMLSVLDPNDLKDTVVRAPWWYMKYRPRLISVNRIRNKSNRGNKQ